MKYVEFFEHLNEYVSNTVKSYWMNPHGEVFELYTDKNPGGHKISTVYNVFDTHQIQFL